VAVLDKSTVAGGTTGRTTGKVTTQHGLIYADLYKRFGKTTAAYYAKAAGSAWKLIASIIDREKISCDWRIEDNYVYTADPSQTEKFKQEAEVARELGLPASFLSAAPLPFETTAAVKFSGQAKFNSQLYTLGLAALVNGDGSFVFENSKVKKIRYRGRGMVATSRGKVKASRIVIATNVPTLPLAARGTYCALEYPEESYVVAGRTSASINGMYISPDKNHYSILPVNINGENMVLLGGESHISGLRVSTKRRYQKLADYAEKYFGVTDIAYMWSDRDYMAYDNFLIAGKVYPWSNNLYTAAAFRKWGLTNGTAGAMIISDLITDKENAWAAVFSPHRITPLTSIPRVFIKHLTG
jgi:glycine/D-amino acid oxidase-like deaminating enzyme